MHLVAQHRPRRAAISELHSIPGRNLGRLTVIGCTRLRPDIRVQHQTGSIIEYSIERENVVNPAAPEAAVTRRHLGAHSLSTLWSLSNTRGDQNHIPIFRVPKNRTVR